VEGFLWIGLVSGKLVVPDKVEVDLAKVKNKGDIFGGGLDPVLNFDSFFLIGLGQTFDAFALHFNVKGVFCMQEHVNEGISECEIINFYEVGLIVFDGVLKFSHIRSVGLRVEIGFW
jgi:hypothetical protein